MDDKTLNQIAENKQRINDRIDILKETNDRLSRLAEDAKRILSSFEGGK